MEDNRNDIRLMRGKGMKSGPAWMSAMESPRREGVFVLDASVSGASIRMSAYTRKPGEERAVRNYREVPFREEKIRQYAAEITGVLNSANRSGKIGNDLVVKLKELGGLLFDRLLPIEIKEMLKATSERDLLLSMDDHLVHVPWELLYDGSAFLCLRFSMGRSVSTRQAVSAAARALNRPLKMKILADPRGDLTGAYEEGLAIKNELAAFEDSLHVSLKTTDISTDYAKTRVRNFDILHYAGHADHDTERPAESGWLLKDGRLTAEEITALSGSRPMPALVFSNACRSGQTGVWKVDADYGSRVFGLANAFLITGVQHYIGTFWEIPDEAAALFARSFYRGLVNGMNVGEAVLQSRRALIRHYGEDTIAWAGYMLYGDPAARYAIPEHAAVAPEAQMQPETSGTRGQFRKAGIKKRWFQATVAAAALIASSLAIALIVEKGKWSAPVVQQRSAEVKPGRLRHQPVRQEQITLKPSPGAEKKSDANVNAANQEGGSALFDAVKANNPAAVKALLDAKADVLQKDISGKTPLDLAANKSRIEILYLLVQSGVKMAAVPDRGAEYLQLAVRNRHAGLAQALMQAGADASRPGPFGNTPLMTAAKEGWSEGVLILTRNNAPLNSVDGMGCTALMQAVKKGDRQMVRVLLEAGADPGIPDAMMGTTPLMALARTRQQEDLARLLIKHGAKVNGRNGFGKTALHIAVEVNNVGFAKVLMDAKADANAADQWGNTPLKVANSSNLKEMVEVLEGR